MGKKKEQFCEWYNDSYHVSCSYGDWQEYWTPKDAEKCSCDAMYSEPKFCPSCGCKVKVIGSNPNKRRESY